MKSQDKTTKIPGTGKIIAIFVENNLSKIQRNKMKSQDKTTKIPGTGKIIAEKLGCTNDYVSRVLNGRVNQNGKKARGILELNKKIADFLK